MSGQTNTLDDAFYDPGQDNNNVANYRYDEEGRLVRDIQEGIDKITWRVDGKVKKIERLSTSSAKNVSFDYDAMGNRIAKHVMNLQNEIEKSTYYVLDAQGNTISVYEKVVDKVAHVITYEQSERHIYGSSRLGLSNVAVGLLGNQNKVYKQSTWTHTIGQKTYEITNHLGNVLSVISDKPIPDILSNGNVVSYYLADIRHSSDYSPFGVELDGRDLGLTGAEDYRYGFGSMEKDDEIKGSGNSYDFGARMYDSRVGRWFSRDELAWKKPQQSPYQSFRNNPIVFIDPDGKDEYIKQIIVDERGEKPQVTVLSSKKVSSKIMTDGNGSKEVHSNNYWDYEKTVYTVIRENGEVSQSSSIKFLKKNGLKDFDVAYGSANTKSSGTTKNTSDGFMWGVTTDVTGSGGTQKGGITFTSDNGGSSHTKQKSLTETEERNIGTLLDVLGASERGSFGDEKADKFKDLLDILDGAGAFEPDTKPTQSGSNGNNQIVVVGSGKNQQGGTSPITWKENKDDATKKYSGTLSPKKDTLYLKK